MDIQGLQDLISDRFKDTIRPQEDLLLHPDCATMYEAAELRTAFSHFSWEKVPNSTLLAHKEALTYFSEEAFIYFLPAYMKLILRDILLADTLVNSLLEKLTLPASEDILNEYIDYLKHDRKLADLGEHYTKELAKIDDLIHDYIKKTALLSYNQSNSVFMFLYYLENNFSAFFNSSIATRAIYRYWFVFK